MHNSPILGAGPSTKHEGVSDYEGSKQSRPEFKHENAVVNPGSVGPGEGKEIGDHVIVQSKRSSRF